MFRKAVSGILALPLIAASPVFACDGGPLFEMIDQPLPATPALTIEVSEVQSTDGGEWDIYLGDERDKARNLLRTDMGESGRWAARLIFVSPDAYAVTTTRYIYSAPYYVSGATTIREERDIYIFCDGRLYLPEEDFGVDPEYAGKAAEALAVFDAPEVARFLPPLKR